MLRFWALAFQFQEDIFYDFAKQEDVHSLEPTCLLPTEELAEQLAEDEVGDDYVPVAIDIERYSNGSMVYSRGRVERWDEE